MVLDRAKPANEIPELLKALIYGYRGVGKTTLAAAAPAPIIVDIERSTTVLRHTPGLERIPVVQPLNGKELLQSVDEFIRHKTYKTYILDSLSTGQDKQLRDHMDQKFKSKMDANERFLPLFFDFRVSTEAFKEMALKLQECDKNVIIICTAREYWEKVEGTDRSVLKAIRPDMTPRLDDAVERLTNTVAYLEKLPSGGMKSPDRRLYVNSTSIIGAKNRKRIQETYITNPTISDL